MKLLILGLLLSSLNISAQEEHYESDFVRNCMDNPQVPQNRDFSPLTHQERLEGCEFQAEKTILKNRLKDLNSQDVLTRDEENELTSIQEALNELN